MMALGIGEQPVSFDDVNGALREAAEWAETAPIIRDLSEQLKDIIYAAIAQNFDSATGPDGTKWPPHAPATIQRHGMHPLLILTGAMKDASTISGAIGNYESVEDQRLVIGCTIDYAQFHQYGTKNIPQREFFGLSDEAVQQIVDLIVEHIKEKILA
jgi:phage gpG-like protein